MQKNFVFSFFFSFFFLFNFASTNFCEWQFSNGFASTKIRDFNQNSGNLIAKVNTFKVVHSSFGGNDLLISFSVISRMKQCIFWLKSSFYSFK